ncbi:unnamed protein product [Caenorhabditis auriculariae]|uniref:RNA-binding motif protein 17 n=1 Tax=Caenorhabditis auriculariae TaxID=2777116 RepID=A0A8S1HF66_9PELO|nr:unnamed protein product [Caenorhabditis auriculariae]
MYDDDDIPLAPPPEKKEKGPDFQMKFFQSQVAQKKNALQAATKGKFPIKPSTSVSLPVIDLSSKNKASPIIGSFQQPLLKPIRASPLTEPLSFLPKAATDDSFVLFGEITVQNEYQLACPNDYEKLSKEMKERKAKEKMAKQVAKRLAKEHKEEESKRGRGAAIAPPTALLEPEPVFEEPKPVSMPPPKFLPAFGKATSKGLGIAANIMSKYGYKEGQGLGRSEQGISTALKVERTGKQGGVIVAEQKKEEGPTTSISMTEAMKNSTKVVLLTNMIGLEELDSEFEEEVKEEMGKYGQVVAVVIHKRESQPPEEQVRVFVEFTNVAQAIKAFVVMNGRFFAGRAVTLRIDQIDANILDDEIENIAQTSIDDVISSLPVHAARYFEMVRPEIRLTMNALLWSHRVYKGCSPGQEIMDIAYKNYTQKKIFAHFCCSVFLPYMARRLPEMTSSVQWSKLVTKFEAVLEAISILHSLYFVRFGGHSTFVEQLLGLRNWNNNFAFYWFVFR